MTFRQSIFLLVSVSMMTTLVACSSGNSGGSTQTPSSTTYTIGGTVSGLSGTGLVLQDNGGNNLAVSANGSFTFTTAIASGGAYAVTVLTQPSSPAQTCAVTGGSGTASANVTSVQIACTTTTTPTYTIGGTVSGLSGTGLVLQNNGGNNLAVSANGGFTFTTAIASGSAYSVTVLTQPSSPAQTCVVTSGSGTATANVTSVQIACTTTTTPTYTIGGTASGLSGSGLVLQDNGGNNLSVSANGSFTFTTSIASGGAYDVTVLTQPSTPAQNCTVTSGSGMATANVTSVAVTCTDQVAAEWGWITGADTNNTDGTYGTQGTAAKANSPGSRDYSVSWTDSSGNLWLFGGIGYDSAGSFGGMNDLWKFSGGEWTWVNGSNLAQPLGSYGTQGTASPSNSPGQRGSAAGWKDASGNFWLFGGDAYSLSSTELYNDLWKYSGGEWTWVSGSNSFNVNGTYGTEGTAASTNVPGAREGAVSWTDKSGNLWLFGGHGLDSVGNYADLNDLWEFNGTQWTWMGGSNVVEKSGVYGTMGTAASGNIPGARFMSCTWTDTAGNFWLFGGSGYDSTGTQGPLNDLWKYSAGEWTWMSGSDVAKQYGSYGTLGTVASTNVPGARSDPGCWTDAAGNFWLYGGTGADSGTTTGGFLGDLWEYSAGEWTWMSGPSLAFQAGTYGTLGTPATGNIPGTRNPAASWVDPSGNFWIFGGLGNFTSPNVESNLNDLWEYIP